MMSCSFCSGFKSGSRPTSNSVFLWSLLPYSPNFIKIRPVVYEKSSQQTNKHTKAIAKSRFSRDNQIHEPNKYTFRKISLLKKPDFLNHFCIELNCALAEANLLTKNTVEQSFILLQSCLSDKLNTIAPIRSSCKWIRKVAGSTRKSRMPSVKGTKFVRNMKITPTRKTIKSFYVNDLWRWDR